MKLFRELKLSFLFLIFPFVLFAQSKRLHQNKFRKGERNGLWITYSDPTNTIIETKGRFRKGNEKGVWIYYDKEGKRRKKEVYRFRKIRTTEYNPDGSIQCKGKAKLEIDAKQLHYYRYGDWQHFSNGRLVKITSYDKGKIVEERKISH